MTSPACRLLFTCYAIAMTAVYSVTGSDDGDYCRNNRIESCTCSVQYPQLYSMTCAGYAGPNVPLMSLETYGLVQFENSNFPEIAAFTFSNASIIQLRLTRCRIRTVSEGAFQSRGPQRLSATLTELYLGHNQLRRLESGTFRGLNHLRALYLNNNRLSHLGDHIFAGLGRLNKLYLDVNELTTIGAPVFRDLPLGEVRLGLTDNPIKCSCSLIWIGALTGNEAVTLTEGIRCSLQGDGHATHNIACVVDPRSACYERMAFVDRCRFQHETTPTIGAASTATEGELTDRVVRTTAVVTLIGSTTDTAIVEVNESILEVVETAPPSGERLGETLNNDTITSSPTSKRVPALGEETVASSGETEDETLEITVSPGTRIGPGSAGEATSGSVESTSGVDGATTTQYHEVRIKHLLKILNEAPTPAKDTEPAENPNPSRNMNIVIFAITTICIIMALLVIIRIYKSKKNVNTNI